MTERVRTAGESAPLSEEEKQLYEALESAFDGERRRIAKLLASKPDGELFGQTEFELRDRVHHLAAETLETAAEERRKKGRLRGC